MLLLRMNIETIKEDSVLNVDKTPVFTITYNQINNYFKIRILIKNQILF